MDKQKAYRLHNHAGGKCTRCGKPSYPFHDCDECRFKKNFSRKVRQLYKRGILIQDKEGRYSLGDTSKQFTEYNTKATDRRRLPRMNNFPMDDVFVLEFFFGALMNHPGLKRQELEELLFRTKTGS